MANIALPSIPTAVLAAFIAFGLNSLKDWIFRKRRQNDEVRKWYQQTITLCERINSVANMEKRMRKFEEEDINDIYDAVSVEENLREKFDSGTPEESIQHMSKQVEEEMTDDILNASDKKLVEDVTEIFISLREHMVNRPRTIESEPEEVEDLMSDLWGIQLTYEIGSRVDFSARDIENHTESIISECESEIQNRSIFN